MLRACRASYDALFVGNYFFCFSVCLSVIVRVLCLQDSGSLLSKRTVTELVRVMDAQGFVSISTAGTIRMWTHPEMLKYLKVLEEDKGHGGAALLDSPNLSGSLVGVRPTQSPYSWISFKFGLVCCLAMVLTQGLLLVCEVSCWVCGRNGSNI